MESTVSACENCLLSAKTGHTCRGRECFLCASCLSACSTGFAYSPLYSVCRTRAPKTPKSPKPPKEKSKHPILRFIGRTVATVLCLGIMLGSVVAVGMVFYVVQATANDGDLLDLDNIQLSQSSMVVATDPDTGAQVEAMRHQYRWRCCHRSGS